MKKIILITLSISLFVEGDYLAHPKSQALIDELVILCLLWSRLLKQILFSLDGSPYHPRSEYD